MSAASQNHVRKLTFHPLSTETSSTFSQAQSLCESSWSNTTWWDIALLILTSILSFLFGPSFLRLPFPSTNESRVLIFCDRFQPPSRHLSHTSSPIQAHFAPSRLNLPPLLPTITLSLLTPTHHLKVLPLQVNKVITLANNLLSNTVHLLMHHLQTLPEDYPVMMLEEVHGTLGKARRKRMETLLLTVDDGKRTRLQTTIVEWVGWVIEERN